MRRAALGVVALLVALGAATPSSAQASPHHEAKWHTTVFAKMPAPGYPAYAFVSRSHRVYAGTYEAGDHARSKVVQWTASGRRLHVWTVPGQRLDADHGVQVANETRDGKLVLLESSTRSVITLDVHTGRFRTVARFPKGVIPDYATWGPRNLFVTDYGDGGGIWRVSRSGRVQRWLTGPELTGVAGFSTTGLVYRPLQHDFLLDQSTVADGSTSPTNGRLYEVGLRRDGRPGPVRTLWTSRPTELPDGFGVARSGHVYVALSGLTQQLVELSASGRELDRFPKAPGTGDNGSRIPFDNPCSATFLGRDVLVANQSALAGDAAHQAILRVHVGEPGLPPHLPRTATFPRERPHSEARDAPQ